MEPTEEATSDRTYVRRNFRRDPIYDYVYLHDYEESIVRTPLFLRLKGITQMHSAFPFYPGATHNRYQHSLGVAHVAGEFTDMILEDAVKHNEIDETEKIRLIRLSRVWGLIHDIGHGPFSHAFDDHVLQMSRKTVDSERITHHDALGLHLARHNKEMKAALNEVESKLKLKRDHLLDVFRMDMPSELVSQPNDYPYMILNNVFWGKYGADFIDYLQRDALYAGTPEYGTLDWKRLVMTSHFYRKGDSKIYCLEDRSKYTLYSFVNSFFQMYQAVYFNKNVRILDYLIGRFLRAVDETGFFDEFLQIGTEEGARKFETLNESFLMGVFSQLDNAEKIDFLEIEPDKFKKAHDLCMRILNVEVKCNDVIEKVYTSKEKAPAIFGQLDLEYFHSVAQLHKMKEKVLSHIGKIFEQVEFEEFTQDRRAECFIDTPRFEKRRCPLYETKFFGFLDRYGNFQDFSEVEHSFLARLPQYIDIIRFYLDNYTISVLCDIQDQNTIKVEGASIVFVNKKNSSMKHIELDHDFLTRLVDLRSTVSLSWVSIVQAILEEVLEKYPKDKVLKQAQD